MSQVSDDLKRAADIVNVLGWCSGSMQDAEGHVCMLGALRISTIGKAVWENALDAADMPQVERFHAARQALHAWLGQAPTVWNDMPGRTAYHVKMALLNTARANQNVGV